ncbi:MAG TPA: glycosyltransferase family 39 protein [Isosphaeraceae bacterium]|nr:glycosyltransferase family 39 protein [Isosphaeraceae bacterium]
MADLRQQDQCPPPAPRTQSPAVSAHSLWTPGRIGLALGILAAAAVIATLGDPGITVDEPLDVAPGRKYVSTLFSTHGRFFDRDVITSVYADNAEHPPLGRWLLGIAASLGEMFGIMPGGPDPFSVHAGRLAPALCFAILVGLIGRESARRFGPAAGVAAGVALILMPRAFAHAHFGALDTFLSLFWTWALLASARALESRRPVLAMVGAGLIWGLALLTKIHAWLLPPVVLVYVLIWHRSATKILAAACWGLTGLLVFFGGWPWLWYGTRARLFAYLGTGVGRASIRVLYFGQVYADRDVPWHYPWFYFAVTVPVGLQILGALGLGQGWRLRRSDPLPMLLAGSIALFLVLFSTRVPVYDGERLFLVAFPLWAMLVGLGFATAWRWAASRRWIQVMLVILLLAQGCGVVALHPFQLSYYNALVGGLPGAQRLGLELTYWGDAIDPVLLDELARHAQPGQTAAMVPTLHHIQATASTTPALAAKEVRLLDETAAPRADWLLVYRRTAYWHPELSKLLEGQGPPIATRARQGVWLGALWPRNLPASGAPDPHPQKSFRTN